MILELSQDFTFEAAHTLARSVPLGEYKSSRRIHGHSYTATVTVDGPIGDNAQVIDLFFLNKEIAPVRDLLDHHFLDEVEGLGAPTIENLCVFIFERIAERLSVSSVTVRRPSSGDACTLRKAAA